MNTNALATRACHAHAASPAADAHRLGAAELVTLRRIAAGLASSGVDPDDLVQDAIERALRSWDRFATGTNLVAWVRTIMQRLAIDAWRRRIRRAHVPLPESLAAPEPGEPSPRAEPWKHYEVSDVLQVLGQLNEPLRTTFRLYALDGRSYIEISLMLGVPVATVGTRMRRARLRLRELLESRAAAGAAVEQLGARRSPRSEALPGAPSEEVTTREIRLARLQRVAA